MKIYISGKNYRCRRPYHRPAADGVAKVEAPQYVTVVVNKAFLPMDRYECFSLKEGDTVEFLYYMGGGCNGADR